jgi:hypothetical protein
MSETATTDPFTSSFPNPSPQLQTVLTYLRAIMKQDIRIYITTLADDHHQERIPPSLDYLGHRIMNREETVAFISGYFGKLFKNFTVRYTFLPLSHN